VGEQQFHDLWHSYATGALRAGVSPKIVSERIGHANVGFLLETYAHVLGNDDREGAEQAAGFLIGDAWSDDEDSSARPPSTGIWRIMTYSRGTRLRFFSVRCR
jgi:hypothetical protein